MKNDDLTAQEKEVYETPDQWKGCGICEKCRRQKYCNTEWSAHRRAMSYWLQNEIVRKLILKKEQSDEQTQV